MSADPAIDDDGLPASSASGKGEDICSSPETSRPPGWENFVPGFPNLLEKNTSNSPEDSASPGWETRFLSDSPLPDEKIDNQYGCDSHNSSVMEKTSKNSPTSSQPPVSGNFGCEPTCPDMEMSSPNSPETSAPPGWESSLSKSPLPEMTTPSSQETTLPLACENLLPEPPLPFQDEKMDNPYQYCSRNSSEMEKASRNSPTSSQPPASGNFGPKPTRADIEMSSPNSPTSAPPGWESFLSKSPLADEKMDNHGYNSHNSSEMVKAYRNSPTSSQLPVLGNFDTEPTCPDTENTIRSSPKTSPPPGWKDIPSKPSLPAEDIEMLQRDDDQNDHNDQTTGSLASEKKQETTLDNSPVPSSGNINQEPPHPEVGQMVCGFCRELHSYPRGATHVQCPRCSTINFVLEAHQVGNVNCGKCSLFLMYPYGAPAVRCSACSWVTKIEPHNIRPPLSVQLGHSYPPTDPVK